MVVGGHRDSWDLGDGSHDDGAGCVQSMEGFEYFFKILVTNLKYNSCSIIYE
jgi:hypothetical protein